MPSTSTKQQHFMGMVHALQTGKASAADMPEGIRSKLKTTAKSISKKSSGEFAKSVEEYFSFPALTFKQYLVVESELMEAFAGLSESEVDAIAEKCGLGESEEHGDEDAIASKKRKAKEDRDEYDADHYEDEEKTTKDAAKRKAK
jgi:hypothetical protein